MLLIYQTQALIPAQTSGAANSRTWPATVNPEVFTKPFPVAEQQYVAHQNFQVPTAPTPKGWAGYQFDHRFAQPFPAGAQQTLAWSNQVFIALKFGWWGQQLDTKFVPPFPVAEQQYSAFQPRGKIGVSYPEGWESQQLIDYSFAKPFPVQSQQYSAFQPRGLITSRFLDGWRTHQFDVSFVKPFPTVEQQALAWGDTVFIDVKFGWWNFQWDLGPGGIRNPLVPAAIQQFDAWPPEPVVFIPPPGAGKYPRLPEYIPQPPREVKPAKLSIRPVWDRPPEAPPLPPPSIFARPPPAPAELFGVPKHQLAGLPIPDYLPPSALDIAEQAKGAMERSDAASAIKALVSPAQPDPAVSQTGTSSGIEDLSDEDLLAIARLLMTYGPKQ